MNMPTKPTEALAALRDAARSDRVIDEHDAEELLAYIKQLEELADTYVDLCNS